MGIKAVGLFKVWKGFCEILPGLAFRFGEFLLFGFRVGIRKVDELHALVEIQSPEVVAGIEIVRLQFKGLFKRLAGQIPVIDIVV